MSIWKPIPGETPIDPTGLLIATVTNRAQLNVVEAENIRTAVVKYLSGPITRNHARFDVAWSLKLHSEMYGDVWQWAGACRDRELNMGAPWRILQGELQNLMDDLLSWPGFEMPFVEQAARLHHRAVTIHPFLNGNGRWARMLANIWLHLNRQGITRWPDQLVGVESPIRTEYIEALRKADNEDFGPLIFLHQQFTRSEP